MSKAEQQRKHAKRRIRERYGISVNRHQLRDIAEQIRQGRALFVERQSNRVTRWVVEYQGKKILVIYDSLRGNVVTALPASAMTTVQSEYHV